MTARDLLAKVDESWTPFREAVRHVGRAKMDEQTGGGWTYHDLFAHVTGWQDLSVRRLRAFRSDGIFPAYNGGVPGIAPFADGDEFNARLISSHRLVGPEALTDELDTTFQSLRRELSGLTDEQVSANDGWVVNVVAGTTFDHFDEHAKELGLG